jgi:quinoprotein glucose dehydrogenase
MAFTFDRVTGEPVWPIEERPVPKGNAPGEWYSPTQPFPTKPAPYDRQGLSNDDLIDFTPELHAEAEEIAKKYVLGPLFTPPSTPGNGPAGKLGTLQMPGQVGGSNWPGAAFDPETHMLYVPSVTGAFYVMLAAKTPGTPGADYRGLRAGVRGPAGLPLTKPPYGRITAINMDRGERVWMVPNGDGPRNHWALKSLNLPPLGQTGRSGIFVTKTLLFVSEGDQSMIDMPPGSGPGAGRKFRAYDKSTGAIVWEMELPAGTNGSPMTYMYNDKQYIVLPIGSPSHPGEWVALSLP